MSFRDDCRRFGLEVDAVDAEIFANVVSAVHESIVDGSPVTGAPGQPVDTGTLRDSWTPEFLSATEARVSTNVEYAPHVEDNVRGVEFKNHGPHSVKLTVAGFDRLVDDVAARARDV